MIIIRLTSNCVFGSPVLYCFYKLFVIEGEILYGVRNIISQNEVSPKLNLDENKCWSDKFVFLPDVVRSMNSCQ